LRGWRFARSRPHIISVFLGGHGAPVERTRRAGIEKKVLKRILAVQKSGNGKSGIGNRESQLVIK
jgi:hypothetical protein